MADVDSTLDVDASTPEPVISYVIYDDGGVETASVFSDTDQHVLSRPGRFVTQAEYEEAAGQIQDAIDAARAERQALEDSNLRGDYLALKGLGLPEAMCRRMSGYTGPA